MPTDFQYDVFLSYSYADRDIVIALADKLREDNLKVWLVKRQRTVDRDRRRRVDHALGCDVAAPRLEARSGA